MAQFHQIKICPPLHQKEITLISQIKRFADWSTLSGNSSKLRRQRYVPTAVRADNWQWKCEYRTFKCTWRVPEYGSLTVGWYIKTSQEPSLRVNMINVHGSCCHGAIDVKKLKLTALNNDENTCNENWNSANYIETTFYFNINIY